MSHTEDFAAFRARRETERAAAKKVTWRKVSDLTGGGWSGLGPDNQLVWVREQTPGYVPFGRVNGSKREQLGWARTVSAAKVRATELLAVGGSAGLEKQ